MCKIHKTQGDGAVCRQRQEAFARELFAPVGGSESAEAFKCQVSDFSFISAGQIKSGSFLSASAQYILTKGRCDAAVVFGNSNFSRKTRHGRRCNYRSNRNYRKPLPRDYVLRCSQFHRLPPPLLLLLLPQRLAYSPNSRDRESTVSFDRLSPTLHPLPSPRFTSSSR